MTNDGKENIRHVTCTNHAARSDKELARVCPSKLSKRELEDIYFSLLENNTQLKKTINSQRDQIKVLTTKVHRMTVQKTPLGSQNKDCCATAKGILNEQKETIEDLKKANERLSDRIRFLNMRICSAKQFLKRSPTQSTSRCVKCCLTPNTSIKNSSMGALNTKESVANLRTDAGSCQILNKDSSTIKAAETESPEVKDEPCHQNKCRTVMDELKQKIGSLEEELSKTHEQYSGRILKLEEEMQELRGENSRVRALQVDSKHRLEIEEKKTGELLRKLRDTEVECGHLATELQIEKSKVSELETQVKSADISSQVADVLEKHLITLTNRRSSITPSKAEQPTLGAADLNDSPLVVPTSETSQYDTEREKERTVIKNSDDSGYADKFEDKKESPKTDSNILDQIASLQEQLNYLKLSMKNSDNTKGHLKTAIRDSLGKSKSELNESYGSVGASSSISNDIFQSLRAKAHKNIDPYPPPRAPEVLMEDINRSSKAGSVKTLQEINMFDRHSKLQIYSPLPVNTPRISYFGEKIEKGITSDSPNQSKKNLNSDTRFDKSFGNKRSNSLNTNIANKETYDENGFEKMRRRFSLRDFNQGKNKDLSVSYDNNKTILGSTITTVDLNKKTRGNNIEKDNSDPSVEFKVNERNLKKKIHNKKENSHNTLGENIETHIRNSEVGSNVNTDKNKNTGETNETQSIKDKLVTSNNGEKHLQDIVQMGKTAESPGTSSGDATYTVEGSPTHGNEIRDETYPVENKNDNATFQMRNGEDQNYLAPGATTIGLTPKQGRTLKPVNTSTPDRVKTYNAERSAEVTRSTSPDNTEHEISSLTDLPNEDKSPRDYISPGEERATSSFTDSYAGATTTDYGSLSLGEVPMIGAKKLSDLEMRDKTTDSLAMSTTSNKMEEALRAISDELNRCRVLLQGQLPAQVIPNLLPEHRFVRR